MHFSGDIATPLEVLLSPNGGRIDGTVINEKRNLMAGVEAVLIPDRRRDRTDLSKREHPSGLLNLRKNPSK